jgi:hypothetical protein
MKPVILTRCCRGRTTGLEKSGSPHFPEVSPSGILFFLRGDSRPCATEEFDEETVRSSCWPSKLSS